MKHTDRLAEIYAELRMNTKFVELLGMIEEYRDTLSTDAIHAVDRGEYKKGAASSVDLLVRTIKDSIAKREKKLKHNK